VNSRQQFKDTLTSLNLSVPPRLESDFAPDVLASWKNQGLLNGHSIEDFFQIEHRENVPVNWSRLGDKRHVTESQAGLENFRRVYDPASPARLPENWGGLLRHWRGRDFPLRVSPWDEGLLQIIGITEWTSFYQAIMLIFENPRQVEAMMEHYADYLETFLDRILAEVEIDYAVFYEVIASNTSLVISPQMYARFALPALRRVVACLERHGVAIRLVWTTGKVEPLIPLWLEAGINGLLVTQTAASGSITWSCGASSAGNCASWAGWIGRRS